MVVLVVVEWIVRSSSAVVDVVVVDMVVAYCQWNLAVVAGVVVGKMSVVVIVPVAVVAKLCLDLLGRLM